MLGIVALLVVGYIIFANVSPQFGGKPTEDQLMAYQNSPNFQEGKFKNAIPTSMDMDTKGMLEVTYKFLKGVAGTEPKAPLPQQQVDSTYIVSNTQSHRLTWFGHSTFLLEIGSKKILIDPMFGKTPAPIPMLGPQRFNKKLPLEVASFPIIDAVLFTHDHYDHLDYGSVMALKDRVEKFYVPLGLGAHLHSWGVAKGKIVELDWWEEVAFKGLTLVSTPARHFSGRGMGDRFSTLWCSWVIKSDTTTLYFSGDSGYGSHFEAIGKKYGPFNLAAIECGQYNERWKDIHMMPEETAQAGIDLRAKTIMPIHWGAFALAFHSWQDPVERVTKKAQQLDLPIATPVIGQTFDLNASSYPNEAWWRELN